MQNICRFTCIRPASGRSVGVCDTPLPGYTNDSCIDDRPRIGYEIDTCIFAAFASYRMRLEGVFDTPLPGYMKNLCRSAGNVFTSRKSPGPFASKESGLGFLLCRISRFLISGKKYSFHLVCTSITDKKGRWNSNVAYISQTF